MTARGPVHVRIGTHEVCVVPVVCTYVIEHPVGDDGTVNDEWVEADAWRAVHDGRRYTALTPEDAARGVLEGR